MIKFQWPYLITLAVLPIIYNYCKKTHTQNSKNNGLLIPFYEEILQNSSYQNNFAYKSHITSFLIYLIWFLVCLSVMRPVYIGDPVELQIPTHDIMMAIDISGSMQDEDMSENYRQTRLDVVKKIAHSFIDERAASRMGLIFFGSQAFVSSPLTLDKNSLHNFLEKSQIGFAGQYTAIGDAIGLAIKRLESGGDANNVRFIILLSDGTNNSGNTDPISAAQIAAKNNIKIYTIGIGKISNDFFDIQSGRDLDEKTLKEIAKMTNAEYFHASSGSALLNIYKKINQLEPNNQEFKTVRPESEWFIYPIFLALLLCMLLFLYRETT